MHSTRRQARSHGAAKLEEAGLSHKGEMLPQRLCDHDVQRVRLQPLAVLASAMG